MAPNFRQNTQTRRGNRSGYVEHDDFEGLPVRQWRQEWVKIAPPPPPDTTQKNDVWAIELPHGMPKDSHLLPPHTQELLRAARSGRLYKRPPPAEEEEVDPDAALAEKTDKKEEDPSTKGYQVKVWKQVARNAEGSTISHLAKRRKGLITLSSSLPAGPSSGPTIMKATVRRIDAAGNPYTQEITLNEGQPVDGEIISTTVVPAPIASASADASVAATPVRRRPPPPKRKPKGPGRGRKKKLPLPASTRPEAAAAGVDSAIGSAQVSGPETGDMKPGDQSESKNQDSEMADDDEGDDGEDDGEEGDDGDEGDEEDSEMPDGDGGTTFQADGETKGETKADPSPPLKTSSAVAEAEPSAEAASVDISTDASLPPPKLPSPPLNLDSSPTQPVLPHIPSHFEGSPLKNVVAATTSPTDSSSKFALNNGEDSSLTSTTETRSAEAPMEPTPVPVISVESLAPSETQADLDVEMSGVVPLPDHADITKQTASVQGTQQSDDAVIAETLPTLDTTQAQVEDITTTRPSPQPTTAPENTSAPHPSQDVLETSVNAETNQEPLGSDAALAPADNVSASGFIDTKVGPTVVERVEENEPESPDLFSGLEAALDQQGGPKEASAPPEIKTDMPKIE